MSDNVDAEKIRAILSTDLSEYSNAERLKPLLVEVLNSMVASDKDVAKLHKELHQARAGATLRGPIAETVAKLATLPPEQSRQVFTAHAASALDAARHSSATANRAASAARNVAATLAHLAKMAQAELDRGNVEAAQRILAQTDQVPIPSPAPDDTVDYELYNIDEGLLTAPVDGELSNLFD